MRAQTKHPATREEILVTLFDLFRRSGYDAVSLADISEATGLGKSSLYHHFPGGKPDMAEAVAEFARDWMRENIVDPLGADAPLARKIGAMMAAVERMYDGGGAPCLIASMMISPSASPKAIETVGAIVGDWIDAIAGAMRRVGLPPGEAKKRATAAVVAIQGGLIVARAARDEKIFTSTLKSAREALIG